MSSCFFIVSLFELFLDRFEYIVDLVYHKLVSVVFGGIVIEQGQGNSKKTRRMT